MKFRDYQSIMIYAAIFCIGYVASLFLTYSFIVMPGLSIIDDRAFVAAFQGLETRFQSSDTAYYLESSPLLNIPALIAFPGSILLTFLSAILSRKKRYCRWIIAAFVLFIAGMVTTGLYNLPSNVEIFNAGDPNIIDVARVRSEFNEGAWTSWNHFRALTSCLALVCLVRSLYLKAS